MAVETPWQQALRNANRANPYPFYEELRKTPVSRQPDGSYVVSTYRELVQLLHDPRVSSDTRKRPGAVQAAGPLDGTIITEDPSEHDVDRRRIAGGVAEPHVVRLGNGAADFMVETLSDFELLEPAASHRLLLGRKYGVPRFGIDTHGTHVYYNMTSLIARRRCPKWRRYS